MKIIIPILSLFMAFISCTKEVGVTGPAGPQGPAGTSGVGPASDTGSIAGRLKLYDEFSFNETAAGGVNVTLTSGALQQSATTDAAGRYQFPGVKTGTYNLSYQKPGYGTMKVFGVSHFGGGAAVTAVKDVVLLHIPGKTAPGSLGILANFSFYTSFSVTLDTSSLTYTQHYLNFSLFISTDKNVSSSNYTYRVGSINPDGLGGYFSVLPKDITILPPFKYGDTLYAVAYSFNLYVHLTNDPGSNYAGVGDAGFYVDPQTGKTIYPNLSNPSNTVKFVY